MKRGGFLKRKTELKRTRVQPVPKPRPVRSVAEQLWKEPHKGICVNCGKSGWMIRHHVVKQQHVHAEGGDEWDLRNAMDLGATCVCHEMHHKSSVSDMRILLTKIPDEAVEFAFELLGRGAHFYLRRHYRDKDERVELALANLEHPDAAG